MWLISRTPTPVQHLNTCITTVTSHSLRRCTSCCTAAAAKMQRNQSLLVRRPAGNWPEFCALFRTSRRSVPSHVRLLCIHTRRNRAALSACGVQVQSGRKLVSEARLLSLTGSTGGWTGLQSAPPPRGLGLKVLQL